MSNEDANDTPTTPRRGFLGWIVGAAAAIGAALVGVPGLAFLVDPLLRRGGGKHPWRPLLPESRVGAEPQLARVIGDEVDAWSRAADQVLGTVWVSRPGGGELLGLSAECPHLGCRIGMDDAREKFTCPCHESGFGLNGEVLYGPSPRGMDPLELRVVDGQVEVRFKRFRTQTSERVEVG